MKMVDRFGVNAAVQSCTGMGASFFDEPKAAIHYFCPHLRLCMAIERIAYRCPGRAQAVVAPGGSPRSAWEPGPEAVARRAGRLLPHEELAEHLISAVKATPTAAEFAGRSATNRERASGFDFPLARRGPKLHPRPSSWGASQDQLDRSAADQPRATGIASDMRQPVGGSIRCTRANRAQLGDEPGQADNLGKLGHRIGQQASIRTEL